VVNDKEWQEWHQHLIKMTASVRRHVQLGRTRHKKEEFDALYSMLGKLNNVTDSVAKIRSDREIKKLRSNYEHDQGLN